MLRTMLRGVVSLSLLLTFTAAICVASPVRKSDDPQPLEAVVQQLTADLRTLQAQMTAAMNALRNEITAKESDIKTLRNQVKRLNATETDRIAFTATVAENYIPDSKNGVIRFSNIVSNEGRAYNPQTGVFTAPSEGIYVFFVSVDVSSDYRELQISRNGRGVVRGNNDLGGRQITTGAALSLKAGDTITVNHYGVSNGYVDGGLESVFEGFKLR